MLAIISDLHLSDGSFGRTLSPGAFQMFAGRLADLARRASWRSDDQYRPIERIDLLLLGDVLDLTRSSRWIETDVRPWNDTHSSSVYECIADVTDRVLRHNATSLRILRAMASEGAIRVPLSGEHRESEMVSVPVRIHYMVGNHDWQLHLRGVSYDMVRQKVSHHLGLANSHTLPFAHDPSESDELIDVLRAHRVMCRHGDVFDPLSFSDDRDIASLGDAIVIDLMVRFDRRVNELLGEDLPPAVRRGLQAMDKIRPVVMIPVWIEGLLESANTPRHIRRTIKETWDELVDEFLELRLVRDRDTWCPFDLVDGLQGSLKFSQRLSIGWAGRISSWLNKLRGGESDTYYERARAEQEFRNRRARHIVYGHTHQFQSMPLDASFADSHVLNQVYFNSGTWQRVYRPTVASTGEQEFIPHDTMTYLCFFQGNERGGRPFETWNGMLGTSLFESTHLECDTAMPRTNARTGSSDGSTRVNAPHFHSGAQVPRVVAQVPKRAGSTVPRNQRTD